MNLGSVLCPSGPDEAQPEQETPANSYNPINLPRISFMSDEHGTGGHARSSEDKVSPHMSLFEGEDDDRP